jgi:hypothetical protein
MFPFLNFFASTKKTPPIDEKLKKALEDKVKRVYILLEASAMPDDVKTSWKSLLSEMTQTHVDRLIALLEKELTETIALMKKEGKAEHELLTSLAQIQKNEIKEKNALHKKTLKQLDDFAQKLSELEDTAQEK